MNFHRISKRFCGCRAGSPSFSPENFLGTVTIVNVTASTASGLGTSSCLRSEVGNKIGCQLQVESRRLARDRLEVRRPVPHALWYSANASAQMTIQGYATGARKSQSKYGSSDVSRLWWFSYWRRSWPLTDSSTDDATTIPFAIIKDVQQFTTTRRCDRESRTFFDFEYLSIF